MEAMEKLKEYNKSSHNDTQFIKKIDEEIKLLKMESLDENP